MQKLPGLLKDGDTILVKASHFMQFEKIVDYLIPDQSSSTI
jgi:UDP-N-acetylmuramoyl-tripeptide--D-alanyl-D-alanine ligase